MEPRTTHIDNDSQGYNFGRLDIYNLINKITMLILTEIDLNYKPILSSLMK